MSVNSTNPSTLFGGTWEQLKDRFLLGSGDTYNNGATGGSATVQLTTAELPSHNHPSASNKFGMFDSLKRTSKRKYTSKDDSGIQYIYSPGTSYSVQSNTGNCGSNSAHNNMPPYLVVYMWKRTA